MKTCLNKEVYSFDIFDTIVTRKVAEPTAIFLLVQKKIEKYDLPDFVKNNFAKLRQETEYYCQKREFIIHNKYDCTLDEIYHFLEKNYQLEKEVVELIKQTEIQEEIDNILPIESNIKKIKDLISQEKKVILISDMYFDAKTLRKIIEQIDKIFADIEIFSSADTGKRKSNGSQYRLIQEKYKIVEHCGDNQFSDCIQAKWNGIKSVKFQTEALKPYESQLLKKYPDNIFVQKSIGISKFLRQNSKKGKVFNFAVSYAAPILYGYVDWLLKETIRRDIKTLYFIARDGFVPKIIADIIIHQRNYNIKTHYFYSSRRASRIADESNIEQFISQVFSELQNIQTEEFIAERFGITVDELRQYGDLKKEVLVNNNEFKKLIIDKHKLKKELFLKYIRQEIDFNERFGFVDLNGTGRTQDNLATLINNEICKCQINSFYFKLQPEFKYQENSLKSSYITTVNLSGLVMELLCRTIHGQTIGYKNINEKICPILEYEKNLNQEKWGFYAYIEGLKGYAEMMSKENINNDTVLYDTYLNHIKGLIDKETADIIGSIPFKQWGYEQNVKEYIPAYNLFNLFNKFDLPNIASSRANIFIKYLSLIINKILEKKTYGFISKKQDLAYIKFFNKKINIRNFIWK